MNTHQISLEQLANLVRTLDEAEQPEVSNSLKEEFDLSPHAVNELLARLAAFKEGKISSRPWNDIKTDFG